MKSVFSSLMLLAMSFAAVAASPPSVLFPLYIYPSAGAWTPLTNVIANNPWITFKVILNPNSGPYPLGSVLYPKTAWAKAMPNLTQYSNVQTYGYVDTNYPDRTDLAIEADILAWSGGPAALVPNAGIFFDDVVTTSAGALYQMNNVITAARTNFSSIIANPGTTPAYPDPRPGQGPVNGIYSMADLVLVYENFYGVSPSSGPANASDVPGYITDNNHGAAYSKLAAAVYGMSTSVNDNNVSGGCNAAQSPLCDFVAAFSGVVDALYVSDLAAIVSGSSKSADYTQVPPNFPNFVAALAIM